MTQLDITALEALSRDYSETPQHLTEMAAGRRRSLTLCAPMQMVPDIVRSLARSNVAVYQVQLLEE